MYFSDAIEKQKIVRQKALNLPISPVKALTRQDIGISSEFSKQSSSISNIINNNNKRDLESVNCDSGLSASVSPKKQKTILPLVCTDYNSSSSSSSED